MAHETFLQSLFKHGLKSNYLKNILPYGSSLVNSITGAKPTGAQIWQAETEQSMAREQMAFQQEMSNTAYQRGVIDMQKAGLNPALMYGSGASASTPSGAMGSSGTGSAPDPVGLIGQMANLKLLGAQSRLLESQADKNYQDIEESKSRVDNIRVQTDYTLKNMDLMDKNIRIAGLQGDALEIANKYLDREKVMALDIQDLSKKEISQNIENAKKAYDLLDAQTKTEVQKLANMQEEYNLLLCQQSLTDEQKKQVSALTYQIGKQTENIITDGKIKEKDLQWYTWNQLGSTVGAAVKGVGKLVAKLPFKKIPKIGFKR